MCVSVGVWERSGAEVWRFLSSDSSDGEWGLFEDLVLVYSGDGVVGRPVKWSGRVVVDAVMYVTFTGCHRRGLIDSYPLWRTVYDYHEQWSNDGTWENIGDRLARESAGRSRAAIRTLPGSVIDARSVQGSLHCWCFYLGF